MKQFHQQVQKLLVDLDSRSTDSTVAILDVDSTLFNVSHRSHGIFQEMAKHNDFEKNHPKISEAIQSWNQFGEIYDPVIFLEHHIGFELSEDLKKSAFQYWFDRFFQDRYLLLDRPYQGAKEFVDQINRLGIPVIYLTGRDRPNMFLGTQESFNLHGFPLDEPEFKLIMKDDFNTPDLDFKRKVLNDLSSDFEHLVFIDNEAENIHLCLDEFPKVDSYLFDSVHSGRSPIDLERMKIIPKWMN